MPVETKTLFENEVDKLNIRTSEINLTPSLTSLTSKSTNFLGSDIEMLFGLFYILQHIKGGCTPIYLTINKKNTLFMNLGINWICHKKDRKMTFPKDFFKNFEKCINRDNIRFIFIFLTLINSHSCISKYNDAHANVIIYDKKTNIFERFEPHGCSVDLLSNWFEVKKFDKYFKKIVKKSFSAKYLTPELCCPRLGIQAVQEHSEHAETGFCEDYALWIIYLRLKNPSISLYRLQVSAIKKIQKKDKGFTNFIKSFSQYLSKKRREMFQNLSKTTQRRIEKNPDSLENLNKSDIHKINQIILKEFNKLY